MNDLHHMTPGEFKAARHRLGLSQAKLAAVLGLYSGRTIRYIEAGERVPSPPLVLCMRYLEAYGPLSSPVKIDRKSG